MDLAVLEGRERPVKEVFKLKNYSRDTLLREFKHLIGKGREEMKEIQAEGVE